jgi:hypothetical protein
MGRFLLVICLATACGSVNQVPDAHQADARPIDAPSVDAPPLCQAPMLTCDTQSINPMTDDQFCGNCTTACTGGLHCHAGTCTDTTASCTAIHNFNPTATDGPYTHETTGEQFFCDMTHGAVQYDELSFGQYNVAYVGYGLLSSAELSDPVISKAFIFLWNHQGGVKNVAIGFTSGNCCFKAADSGALWLSFGGHYLYPATAATDATQCGGPYNDATYRVFQAEAGPYAPLTLPDNYFVTNPVSNITGCSDGNNPGLFWKRH